GVTAPAAHPPGASGAQRSRASTPGKLRGAFRQKGLNPLLKVGAAVAKRDEVPIIHARGALAHAAYHLLAGAHGERGLAGDLAGERLRALDQGLRRIEKLAYEPHAAGLVEALQSRRQQQADVPANS